MDIKFGLGQHPQTGKAVLLVGGDPEVWSYPAVLKLLRVLKQGFPDAFKEVERELILPSGAKSKLEIPEEIGGGSDGS